MEASPPTEEVAYEKSSRDEGEVMLLEAEPREPLPEKRRHSKCSVKGKSGKSKSSLGNTLLWAARSP